MSSGKKDIKEDYRDCIRLKAKKFPDIQRLLIKEIKKRYNADIKFIKWVPEKPVKIRRTNNGPIGLGPYNEANDPYEKQFSYAWYGIIEGEIFCKNAEITFGEIFAWWGGKHVNQLASFYTSNGCYGKRFAGTFHFFIDDFPHVKEDYIKNSLIEQL